MHRETEPIQKNLPFQAGSHQENFYNCVENEIASLQFFARNFGIELWSMPGAVGFYFPITVLQTNKAGMKKKLTTVSE